MQVKDAITGAALEQFLRADILRLAMPPSSRSPAAGSSRLQEWIRAAQESATSIGRMPPVSATLRSRIGEVLVRIVRRMLFWYTPQIVSFNTATVGALREIEKRLAELESQGATGIDELVDQTARAIESGGIAILETANPETLCARLEARGLQLDVARHGPRLYALTARKPACGS